MWRTAHVVAADCVVPGEVVSRAGELMIAFIGLGSVGAA
jgi:hypothetical protein